MPYVKHLSKDKKLAPVIKSKGRLDLAGRKNVFRSLCSSIMSQQLSTKVAQVIYNRFLDLFNGNEPSAQQLLEIPNEKLRAIGLSNSKVSYIKNVAQFAIEKGLDHRKLKKMDNEQFITYITEIKGVGRWTAEMLLMFTLAREDVFSVDDYGLQQAVIGIYKLRTKDKKKLRERILKISQTWTPYRTYACMYLWRWRDNE